MASEETTEAEIKSEEAPVQESESVSKPVVSARCIFLTEREGTVD